MIGLTIKDLVVFLFIINVVNACGQKKISSNDLILERSLKEFKTLETNKNFKFKFKSKYIQSAYGKSDHDEYFYLYQSKQDLSGNLASFQVCLKNNKLTLISFNKFYSDDFNLHFIKKNQDIDTVYYYKKGKLSRNKNFIVGKYNFYFGTYTKKQMNLYITHRDSLKKVRGNIKLFKGME